MVLKTGSLLTKILKFYVFLSFKLLSPEGLAHKVFMHSVGFGFPSAYACISVLT